MDKKKHYIAIGFALAIIALLFVFRFSGGAESFLKSYTAEGKHIVPVIVVAAIVDSINPCAFSVLLLTIAFLFSMGKTRTNILATGASYIFGVFAAYILIGLGVLNVLTLFGIPRFMSTVGAALIIAFGLTDLLNHYFPTFPIQLKLPKGAHRPIAKLMERASIPTAFLLGGFIGLCEFPCTGGPYLFILGLLHDEATALAGFGYLALYNFIFVLPLIIILLIASDPLLLERVQAWRKDETGTMRVWGGLVMIILGLLILAL
jgi:cytochrome c-type biogenesis protein